MKQKNSQTKVTDNVTAPNCGTALPAINSTTPSFAAPSLNLAAISAYPVVPANQTVSIPVPAPSSAVVPAPGSPPSSDPFLKLKIESLKEKQRSDSFFNSLPPEQQLKVMNWIDSIDNLVDVWSRVTKPAPEGLGLKVNLQTLRRLRDAWRAQDLTELATSSLDVVIDLEEQTGFTHAARFQTAMNQMLSERAFDLMRTQPRSELLPELIGNIQKLTELELKRQKLQLQREKLLVKPTSPAPNSTEHPVQHHRVGLNIVPQNGLPRRETVVIDSEPQPLSQPLLPRPSEGRG